MKKFLALFLTLTLLAGLTACKGREAIAEAQVVHVVTAPTDDATFVYEPEDPTQVLPGGQTIALVTGPGGTDSGEDAMLWQGVQTFANTYHYTAVSQTAAGSTADDAEAALRAAAESGAKLVVCRGEVMGQAGPRRPPLRAGAAPPPQRLRWPCPPPYSRPKAQPTDAFS